MKEEEVIAYKVVGKGHRYGTNVTIYLEKFADKNARKKERKKLKKLPPYLRPRYFKGTTIKADSSTVGLMCFTTIDYALSFIRKSSTSRQMKVVKVVAKLRSNHNSRLVVLGCGSNPFRLLHIDSYRKDYPVHGTVFCSEVTVLE